MLSDTFERSIDLTLNIRIITIMEEQNKKLIYDNIQLSQEITRVQQSLKASDELLQQERAETEILRGRIQ